MDKIAAEGVSVAVRLLGLFGALAAVLVTAGCAQPTDAVISAGYPYSPAFVDAQLKKLHIFPLAGREEEQTALPVALVPATYSPDGESLYGFKPARMGEPGLLRFDISTGRLAMVPGSLGVGGAAGMVVSADGSRILLSVMHRLRGGMSCGIVEFRPRDGERKMLVANPGCPGVFREPAMGLAMWDRLSLSPDNERLVAVNNLGLNLIDLATGAIQVLGRNYTAGAWSPDGKWLAVVDSSSNKTLLLDAKTLKQERTLGGSLAQWSPDSRYLLDLGTDLCGPSWYTFGLIDVQTGQRLSVRSSHCKVNLSSYGWIAIQPKKAAR